MECKEIKRIATESDDHELTEEQLAEVSGGTVDTEAEIIHTMPEKAEEDVQEVTPLVGAIVME